ncbi:hypothetical protein ACJX0J_022267 [Zea mays]
MKPTKRWNWVWMNGWYRLVEYWDVNIDATPDPLSLNLSFARERANVQAWGEILCIIHIELIKSTSCGEAQISTKIYIKWSKSVAGLGVRVEALFFFGISPLVSYFVLDFICELKPSLIYVGPLGYNGTIPYDLHSLENVRVSDIAWLMMN